MKAIIPPPKKPAPRKYWYVLRTPAGDCLVSALCSSTIPAYIGHCATLLARARSAVTIDPVSSGDAYKLVRHGVQVYGWSDKARFVLEILRCYYDV